MNITKLSFLLLASFFLHGHDETSSTEKLFTTIYEEKLWFADETYSGPGSRLIETPLIRKAIPELLKELGVQSILDAGCGDFNWLKVAELPIQTYIGIDIVASMIENNKKNYATAHRTFLHRNIIEDELPRAELVLCRDVLNHLPLRDVKKVIKNFKKSGAKYLLITLQTTALENRETCDSHWRALNFTLQPFNFPQPELIINEGNYSGDRGKSLALWFLDNIDIFDPLS